jgi:hypothetical protein
MKFAPGPEAGGPSSIFQDEGASTEVTGSLVSSNALMTPGKGSRTSPEKEKPVGISYQLRLRGICEDGPKIASTIWSVSLSTEWKSSVNGMSRFLS